MNIHPIKFSVLALYEVMNSVLHGIIENNWIKRVGMIQNRSNVLREDIKKKTADLVKIASFTLPPPPYLKSEKQKNEILVCLRPPLPPG